jgi:Na+/proline symporter
MTRDELQGEIKNQRRKVVRHGSILLFAVFAVVISAKKIGSSHLAKSTTIGLFILLFILCFLLGCGVLLYDLAELWRQRWVLGGKQQKVSLSSIWRRE